jgi:DNA-binding transcriptional MerR regulator
MCVCDEIVTLRELRNLGGRPMMKPEVEFRRGAEVRVSGGAVSSTIGELSLATGVPIVTLRDWDRRHGLSPSHRTIGNHRRYTEADVALVTRVRDLVGQGVRLRASVAQAKADHQAGLAQPAEPASGRAAADYERLRAGVAASRAASISRRDELVAARELLIAQRQTLVRQHGDMLAQIAGELSDAPPARAPRAAAAN